MYLAPVAKANQEQQPKGRAVKKRLTIVCLGIVLVAGVVLVGRPIYEQRRITSAMAKLKDEDSPVEERIKAAARLGAMGPVTKEVIPALIWALQQERSPECSLTSDSLAGQAAHELAKIGPPAIPSMIELLEHEDARARHWGAQGGSDVWETPGVFVVLRDLRSHAAVREALQKALKDDDRHIRSSAAYALAHTEAKKKGASTRILTPPAPDGSQARELTRWMKHLSHKHANARAWAAIHLGEMGVDAKVAVPTLNQALNDEDARVKSLASWALEQVDWLNPKFKDANIRGGRFKIDDKDPDKSVVEVNLNFERRVTDADLEHLKGFAKLRSLHLAGTQITDAGLEHLKGLTDLQELILGMMTQITDAGLEPLKGLTDLRSLHLPSNITDAGLEHLNGLTQLKTLNLRFTKVTDDGLQHLKGFTNLETLDLFRTQVSDAGMEHLKGLTNLQSLNLRDTRVTEAGVDELQKALPKLKINR